MGDEILGSVSYLLLQVKTPKFHDFRTLAFILFFNLQLGIRHGGEGLAPPQLYSESGGVAPKQGGNFWDLVYSSLAVNGALTEADGWETSHICLASSQRDD